MRTQTSATTAEPINGSEASEEQNKEMEEAVQAASSKGSTSTWNEEDIAAEPLGGATEAHVNAPEWRDSCHFGGERDKGNARPLETFAGLFGNESAPSSTRRDWEEIAPSPTGEQLSAIRPGSSGRSSRMGKFIPPPAFTQRIGQADKFERWVKWKAAFDIALAVAGGAPSELQKAGMLFTCVGDEIRDVVTMLELPPLHEERRCESGEYVELSKGLHNYFRTLVDESTLHARYHARVQQSAETAHDFCLHLRQLGKAISVDHGSFQFKHHFLAGLLNRTLAERAVEEDLSVAEVFRRSGRIEQANEVRKAKQLFSEDHGQAGVVMAVHKGGPSTRSIEAKRKFFEKKDGPRAKWGKCGTCGRREHPRGRTCPAIGKKCNKCGELNHFEEVCKAKYVKPEASGPKQEGPKVLEN